MDPRLCGAVVPLIMMLQGTATYRRNEPISGLPAEGIHHVGHIAGIHEGQLRFKCFAPHNANGPTLQDHRAELAQGHHRSLLDAQDTPTNGT